jgi:tetrahydrodipicolinate N-succinyltransferase
VSSSAGPSIPIAIGQRTVFGHRATIVGARVGDLCEIGNGAILMPGSRLGDGCILGEGTLIPAGTIIPDETVLVGRPPHVLRTATDADRARLAALRSGQVNLTRHPGTTVHTPPVAGVRMGQLYAYRDKTPALPTPRCCSTPPRSPATSSSATARSSAPA